MWIGIAVSLLSQYGDLAASAIKRKLGAKDFGNILPGHGGLADRFDGWIFVLPVAWLATQG
jgi:phosphatidate cytidylyltransferase